MTKSAVVAEISDSYLRLKFVRNTPVFRATQYHPTRDCRSCSSIERSMARGRAAPAVVVDDDDAGAGFEKWNDMQTLALGMAWNKVSMDPASNGTSQKRDPFWELVGIQYHACYRELGGIDMSNGKKKRNGKGCKNKWSTMNLQVMRFLACDIQSSHTERKSGHGVEEFRVDALKYFKARHTKDFTFERVYDYLKVLPKWLTDTAQHARTVAKAKTNKLVRRKRERMQVSGSDTEDSIEKGLGQKKARRVKIELSEAESKLKELHVKRAADVAMFREKAVIQLKSIESEMLRARVDEEAEDNRIMAMDLTGMDEMRVSYFHKKMTEIVERQSKRHTDALEEEAAAYAAEAERAASASATEVPRDLDNAFVHVVEGTPTALEGLHGSHEEATPEKVIDLSGLDDMDAFASMCERMAAEADLHNEMAENGVWPEVAGVEETVIMSSPMPTLPTVHDL